jgi:uncharacterized cupin superfamily protein
MPLPAILVPPGEGEVLDYRDGESSRVLAGCDATGGAFSVVEHRLRPGTEGPPLHRHEQLCDAFFVLEGTLTLQVEQDRVGAPEGTFACFPPGIAHTFANESEDVVRVLNINAPGAGDKALLRWLARCLRRREGDPFSAERGSRVSGRRLERRPVTPEVAGSSPVAPVSKSACKTRASVAFIGRNLRFRPQAFAARRYSPASLLRAESPAKHAIECAGVLTALRPAAENRSCCERASVIHLAQPRLTRPFVQGRQHDHVQSSLHLDSWPAPESGSRYSIPRAT